MGWLEQYEPNKKAQWKKTVVAMKCTSPTTNGASSNGNVRVWASRFLFLLILTQISQFNGREWAKLYAENEETVEDQAASLAKRIEARERLLQRQLVEESSPQKEESPAKQTIEELTEERTSLLRLRSELIEERTTLLHEDPKETPATQPTEEPTNSRTDAPKDSVVIQNTPPATEPQAEANSPVVCTDENDDPQCCGTWDINADDWWTHKPDWEISLENATHFCFAPMKDRNKAAFLNQIHQRQWHGNCSHVEKSVEMNSGFGASTSWLDQAFWHAHKDNRPFQIVNGTRRWLYSTANQSNWAYCATEDTRCYWLDISNCSREETIRGEHHRARPGGTRENKEQYYWLRSYMTRPRQHFRRKIYETRQSLNLPSQCTTMHIRRGDAGLPRPPFRRYAAVGEYIEAGNIEEGETIFLMTDDESTIQEIQKHLANDYNWVYLNKTRTNNIKGGFDGHVPSGDGGMEMLAIITELELATTCGKLVHGHSGFIKSLIETLKLEGRNVTRHYLDTSVSKKEAEKFGNKTARVQSFLTEIEAFYDERTKPKNSTKSEQDMPLDTTADHNGNLLVKWNASSNGVQADTKEVPRQSSPNLNPTLTAIDTLSAATEDKKTIRQNISLVTSFFADGVLTLSNPASSATVKAQHLHEISAAILKNIHNPYFAQVVVILDGARNEVNCSHFREYLENMEKELLEWSHQQASSTILHDTHVHQQSLQKLTCVNREQGQPNYFEMFQYATNSNAASRIVTSPIVILENADHVFDKTLHWAGLIKPNTLLTLPSCGYNKSQAPAEVTTYFQFANRNVSKPIDWDTLRLHNFCKPRSQSWDGYVFHQDYVRGTLDPSAFERPTNKKSTAFFTMNEFRGENAALGSLLKNLPTGTYSSHGWRSIKTWHYHAGSKMHASTKTRGFEWATLEPFGKPSSTWKAEDAFVVDPKTLNTEESSDAPKAVVSLPKGWKEYIDPKSGKTYYSNKKSDKTTWNRPTEVSEAASSSTNPLACSENSEGKTTCCGSWDVDADSWWLHKPDWEVSAENETSYCFSKMQDEKAEFFRKLHDLQWFSGNCSESLSAWQIDSGWGAASSWLSYTFLKARQENKPFQIQMPEHRWLYGPKDNSSWAWCPEQDITCYFLPISVCPRHTERYKPRPWMKPKRGREGNADFEWQKEYMMRPKHIMRKKLFEMKQSLKVPAPNCTTMHIRRGDAGFVQQPFRRYAAVQEYIDAAHVEEGDTIFLMTDDNSTLEEIHEHHPNYTWIYLDRPRVNGLEGGFQGHIPSGKPEFEILTIFTEVQLAADCGKVVHGQSGFMKVLRGKMEAMGKKYTYHSVKTGVSPSEAKKWQGNDKGRLEHFAEEMAEYRRRSREAKLNATAVSQ